MEDVKNTLRPLEWTSTVRKIDKSDTFPMVVKPTAATAKSYGISEEPVLLHHFWITQRLVAQNLEDEGAYVVGPQMEIPSDYTGTFQYRPDQKGNSDMVQTFSSVKEIASAMPEKVFVHERLVVYPTTAHDFATNGEKVRSMVLHPREQLTVIEKKDVYTVLPVSRFVFGGKSKYKFVSVPCVTFMNETTKETINLPFNTWGKFSTLTYIPTQGREFDFKDILNEIDLPINLTTCRNCPQTLLDEHFLRPAMRLRITAVEEHEVILGVMTHEKFVEFAVDGVEFLVPKYLSGVEDREQEIAYQTALQRFLMECQIKNSPVNIKDYRKSIRSHISRTIRPTAPKALSSVAATRSCKFTSSMPVQNGLTAIALFSASNSSSHQSRRSSLPPEQKLQRHAAPLPLPPVALQEPTPPLPPRNARSLRGSPKRPKSARQMGYAFQDSWNDMPSRPPPPAPDFNPPERPKSNSMSSFTDMSTVSSSSPDEQIWEALDENCLQKLRQRRNSQEKKDSVAFENVEKNVNNKDPGLTIHPVDSILNGPVISLDDLERSPSPEFHMPLRTPNSFPESDPYKDAIVPEIPAPVEPEESPTDTNKQQVQNYENMFPMHAGEESEASDNEVDASSESEKEGELILSSQDDVRTAIVRREMSTSSEGDQPEESDTSKTTKETSLSSRSSPMLQNEKNEFHMSRYSISDDCNTVGHHVSFTCNYVSSPKDWMPPGNLSEMSVAEVANSLRYIGMTEDTVEWFRAEKVDGNLLCSIEDEVLTQHFRLTPFQRKKMVMFLNGWRPKLE